MNELLLKLATDHKYMRKIQTCLKQEMHSHFSEGQPLNCDLMLDIMYYLTNYADFFHHPLEDRIYQKIRYRIEDQRTLTMLERMESEHVELKRRARQLQEDFLALDQGQSIMDETLRIDAFSYIDMSETHMIGEDKYLFPAIERYLLESDIASIDKAWRQEDGSIFDTPIPDIAGAY